MLKKQVVLLSLINIALAPIVAAQGEPFELGTADGRPPSIETVCDGESGAAFGLCNAYCEAMDCELANDGDRRTKASASSTACEKVRDRYMQLTGEDLPCEAACPCVGAGFDGWDALGTEECSAEIVPCTGCGLNFFGITTFDLAGIPFTYVDNEELSGFQANMCGTQSPTVYVEISREQALVCISLVQGSCSL